MAPSDGFWKKCTCKCWTAENHEQVIKFSGMLQTIESALITVHDPPPPKNPCLWDIGYVDSNLYGH